MTNSSIGLKLRPTGNRNQPRVQAAASLIALTCAERPCYLDAMANQPVTFTGEIGIHYPLHVLNRYTLPELIGLAERAVKTMGPFGFTRVWTNDNLEYRSVLASSAAILASLPVKLGTAVTVPYFRNPIDVAMAFATMSELANGKEISLGLGPGSRSILTRHVVRTKPLTIMAELAVALRTLVCRRHASPEGHSDPGRLFSFEFGTLRAAFQNSGADPSLLRAEPAQACSARFSRAPLRRSDFANPLRHRRHGSFAGATQRRARAIRRCRAAAQNHAPQRFGIARQPSRPPTCQTLCLPYRVGMAR